MKVTTVRFPDEVYDAVQREAYEVGASINSYLMTLIHLGRKTMNCAGTIENECQDQTNQDQSGHSSIHIRERINPQEIQPER